MLDGRVQTRYCANMFNIGFDCNVVDLTAKLKTYPLLAGSMAYLMAVLCILIKKKGADLRVELDGEDVYKRQCYNHVQCSRCAKCTVGNENSSLFVTVLFC